MPSTTYQHAPRPGVFPLFINQPVANCHPRFDPFRTAPAPRLSTVPQCRRRAVPASRDTRENAVSRHALQDLSAASIQLDQMVASKGAPLEM